MGLVVEKVIFGSKVVNSGTNPVVGVAKSFDTSAKEGIFFTELNSSLPNNSANTHGVRATDASFVFLGNDSGSI